MKHSVIKLESFTADPERGPRLVPETVIDDAYREGMDAGRAAQASAETAGLTAAMRDLAAELSREDERRAALRREAVRALMPLLSEILDAMAPVGLSQRLERALVDELQRLAQMTPPLQCRVACSPDLRATVERCAAEAGLAAIEIDERPLGRELQLSLQGGHIAFSPEPVAQSLRQLIAEIQED